MTIEPTPTSTACSSSATLLLLPWKPRRAGSAPAARATASSPPRADVDREALFGDPADDLGAQERLAGVVDPRLHAVERRRGAEGVERAARVRAHLVLVDDVERCAESLAQRGRRDAAELEHAVVVARRGVGPDGRHQGVRVIRHGEPRRGQRAGVRGGGHGWDQSVGASAHGRPDRPSARMPRPVDARAGQCLKSRARGIRPSRRASYASRSRFARAVLLQRGVGDDRAVDVEVGDELRRRRPPPPSASGRRGCTARCRRSSRAARRRRAGRTAAAEPSAVISAPASCSDAGVRTRSPSTR